MINVFISLVPINNSPAFFQCLSHSGKVLDNGTDVKKDKKGSKQREETKHRNVPQISEKEEKEFVHSASNSTFSASKRDVISAPPEGMFEGAGSSLHSSEGLVTNSPSILQEHKNVRSQHSIQNKENIENSQQRQLNPTWQPQSFLRGQ